MSHLLDGMDFLPGDLVEIHSFFDRPLNGKQGIVEKVGAGVSVKLLNGAHVTVPRKHLKHSERRPLPPPPTEEERATALAHFKKLFADPAKKARKR